jgi:hypothetical protein
MMLEQTAEQHTVGSVEMLLCIPMENEQGVRGGK